MSDVKASKKVKDPVHAYHEAEYFAMVAHAISGGIESPLQFVLQVVCVCGGIGVVSTFVYFPFTTIHQDILLFLVGLTFKPFTALHTLIVHTTLP